MTNNYTINKNKSSFEKLGSTVCTDVRCIFYIYLTSERNIFRFHFLQYTGSHIYAGCVL